MLTARASLVAALLACACAHAEDRAKPDSSSRGDTREVSDFRGVAINSGMKAEVKVGPKSVRIEGDPEAVSRVLLEVKDGILEARAERNGHFFSSGMRGKVRLYISSPKVTSLEANGGSSITAEATSSSEFTVEATGGSEVDVRGVDTDELKAEASGGSNMTVRGRATEMDAEASGGSEVHAREVRGISRLEAEISGGSSVEADAPKHVKGEASGGSTLSLTARPDHSKFETSGGSRMTY
ncbi:DUF2807 domain-containing protein [Myxococcaceae bacterium JPH2]|nr:DUF2807 domain-containing protein [Myxococcaceae bacterium JPH2]